MFVSRNSLHQVLLPLWTISLALEPTDCVLYSKTKMAGKIKRRVLGMIIMLSYNVSLYGLGISPCFFQPHDVTFLGLPP